MNFFITILLGPDGLHDSGHDQVQQEKTVDLAAMGKSLLRFMETRDVSVPNLTLRLPRANEEAEFLRAHLATTPSVPSFLHYYREGMTLGEYVAVLADLGQGLNLPSPDQVPETFLFAYVADRIVGRIAIRHWLTESLEREGGHIGYVVVPGFRRQGYATAMLRMALPIAREKSGATQILVTCDDGNVGSARTIEKNGGTLENVVAIPESGKAVRRYWIRVA